MVADQLAGKVGIVTGGSSGIGAAIVKRLQAEGAVCHAASRRGPVKVDVSDRSEVDAFVQTLDRIDFLVCAAGDNVKERRLSDLTPDAWDHILAVNLTGAFHFVDAAIEKLRTSRGHVIFIGSVSAEWPDGSGAAYQASKAGLTALARAAALEEHEHGVRFSVVHPGLTNTPLLQKRPAPPTARVIEAMLLPEDIAEACLFVLALPRRAHVAEMTILPSRLQVLGLTAQANPEPIPE